MSFGFSLGDFIVVADKALLLYKRCSLASADYTELANHVLVLQTVATEVQAFARDNEIPQDEQKVASLVAARQNCMTILDELDAVLVKHTRLGSSKKRWIDVVKFVKKDVNAMKSKLAHVTALMQLALASLTSLSVKQLQHSLDKILAEHKTGNRERSVISRALVEDEPIPRVEILEQLEIELEDLDVHPDSINLNQQFIMSWMSEVMHDTSYEYQRYPDLETIHTSDTARSASSAGDETDAFNGLDVSILRSELASSHQDINEGSNEIHASSDGDRSEISTIRSVEPIRHGRLPLRRKPVKSLPSDSFDPESVYHILCPLFKGDPYHPPHPDQAQPSLYRAFQQQDWRHLTYLTRSEVLETCLGVLERCKIRSHNLEHIKQMVSHFDASRDRRMNGEDFINVMTELIKITAGLRIQDARVELKKWGEPVSKSQLVSQLRELNNVLPWGIQKCTDGGNGEMYTDTVTGKTLSKRPEVFQRDYSFALMTKQADICVEAIDKFQMRWVNAVSKLRQSTFLETLAGVRAAALKCLHLGDEVLSEDHGMSRLDVLTTCYWMKHTRTLSQDALTTKYMLKYLVAIKATALDLLVSIQGFCAILELVEKRLLESSKADVNFEVTWNDFQIELCAQMIKHDHERWNHDVPNIPETDRNLVSTLQDTAYSAAREYIKSLEIAVRAIPAAGKLHTMACHDSAFLQTMRRPKNIFLNVLKEASIYGRGSTSLTITVIDPPQSIDLKAQTYSPQYGCTWHGDLHFDIFPESKVGFELRVGTYTRVIVASVAKEITVDTDKGFPRQGGKALDSLSLQKWHCYDLPEYIHRDIYSPQTITHRQVQLTYSDDTYEISLTILLSKQLEAKDLWSKLENSGWRDLTIPKDDLET